MAWSLPPAQAVGITSLLDLRAQDQSQGQAQGDYDGRNQQGDLHSSASFGGPMASLRTCSISTSCKPSPFTCDSPEARRYAAALPMAEDYAARRPVCTRASTLVHARAHINDSVGGSGSVPIWSFLRWQRVGAQKSANWRPDPGSDAWTPGGDNERSGAPGEHPVCPGSHRPGPVPGRVPEVRQGRRTGDPRHGPTQAPSIKRNPKKLNNPATRFS